VTLVSEFLNGPFGDPALYMHTLNSQGASLFDCGDLSRFSQSRLLRIDSIFLSHCHIDHVFAFDLLLRAVVGAQKEITIYGPPETSLRIGGKLQGYTWNLIGKQDLGFVVVDLDPALGTRTRTRLHASERFHPKPLGIEAWDPATVIHRAEGYEIRTLPLDHRTLSLSFSAETLPSLAVLAEHLPALGLRAGAWINELKLRPSLEGDIEVITVTGTRERRAVDWRGFLSDYCLVSQEESPRSLGRVIRTLFARRDDSLCPTAGAHFAALRLAARLTAAVITPLLG